MLKVESKYRHLDTFSDDPVEDVYILYAFGCANYDCWTKNETCLNRAIEYYERAKERMEDSDAGNRQEVQKCIKPGIEIALALLYSEVRDMEKGISSHRWLLVNCDCHEVTTDYLIHLSSNFNRFEKFEYTIEVLEGAMDLTETVEEEVMAETLLIAAYIGCSEFLKAKAANEKRRSNDWTSSKRDAVREDRRRTV